MLISQEIGIAVKNFHIWSYLSTTDVKNRFRRSKLGVAWPVIHQLVFSLGAGVIWSTVFHLKLQEFVPSLTLGFAIWGFVVATMTEGCSAFIIAYGYMKQLPLPQSIFIFRTLLTQLIYLMIGFFTALVILLYFGKLTLAGLLFAIPGILILIIYGYGAIGLTAYLGLRYRDLPHGLAGMFNLLFVVTPVIYPAEVLIQRGLAVAVLGNPFASLIEIVRSPILQAHFADPIHYVTSSIFTIILVSLRFYLSNRWGRFVLFWS